MASTSDIAPALAAGIARDVKDPVVRQMRYALGEGHFSHHGPALAAMGWSVFPQERGEKRRSAIIDGEGLKWRPYQHVAADAATVRRWAALVPNHNVAVIFGQASGNTFALDIDVTDERLSWNIEKAADRHLGVSPFKRVGRKPKILLIYRIAPETELRNRSYRFAMPVEGDSEPERSEDQIEILAQGKPATFYGLHHKTSQYFTWLNQHPSRKSPEAAPLVTPEQLDAFLEEVQKLRPFYRPPAAAGGGVEWAFDETTEMRVPRIRDLGEHWSTNADGLVTDGRERYLYELARRAVRLNAGAANDTSDRGPGTIKHLVSTQFRETAVVDGRWTEEFIRREVSEKVDRSIRMLREGELTPISERRDSTGQVVAPEARSRAPERAEVTGLDSLTFLPKSSSVSAVGGRRAIAAVVSTQEAQAKAERALIPDRSQIAKQVQAGIGETLDTFFDQIYQDDPEAESPIRVLAAPTGAGKTTATIRYIAKDERTYAWDSDPDNSPGPILFLLPTYANIEELRVRSQVLNLDASLDDDELAAQAIEKGLIPESQMEARIADLRRDAMSASLRTMTYKGKLAAGCKMEDKLRLLMQAGIGSAGLCRATVTDSEGEKEDRYCVHYSTCPAIQQRKEIARSHVVFLPHAFFTLTIPEELKKVRAVIADERIFHLFVHTATLSFETLKSPRRPPKLTKREREDGVLPDELLLDRERAAEIAANALQGGRCPARALADYHVTNHDTVVTGAMLVKSALRVCGNAMTSSAAITPETAVEELRDLCNMPTGTEVREEYRFWKIIEERLELLDKDKAHAPLAELTGLPYQCKAKGKREMRIQFLLEDTDSGFKREKIRLSWRSSPNWINAPIMLLDASASKEIIGKVFDQRVVELHDVDAPLNVRTVVAIDSTYSNASIVAGRNKTWEEKAYAGRRKENLRRLLSNISGLYGNGRVVFGASVVVRRALNTAWAAPSNVDFCHFGAMRGLDFAKNHVAAVSVGRMEVPVHTIDGIVAALTFDDDEPEEPFDRNGDSTGYDGQPLRLPVENQVMRMRGGEDATVGVPTYPGSWARIVQRQYREEELKQFVGRLRPVYREGEAPVWFAISKVVPDNVIVDELVNLEDLIKRNTRYIRLFEAVRLCGGVLHSTLAHAVMSEYRSPEAAANDIKAYGFGEQDGNCGIEHRWTWGFTPVKVRGPDQAVTYAFVRTDIRDPETQVRNAFAHVLGWNVDDFDIEAGDPVRPRMFGNEREDDWVDAQIGTRPDRRIDEDLTLRRCAEKALMINSEAEMLDSYGRAYPVSPTFRLAREITSPAAIVNLQEAAAIASTDLMWDRLHGSEDEALSSPVLALGDDYSDLGSGAWDEDEAVPIVDGSLASVHAE